MALVLPEVRRAPHAVEVREAGPRCPALESATDARASRTRAGRVPEGGLRHLMPVGLGPRRCVPGLAIRTVQAALPTPPGPSGMSPREAARPAASPPGQWAGPDGWPSPGPPFLQASPRAQGPPRMRHATQQSRVARVRPAEQTERRGEAPVGGLRLRSALRSSLRARSCRAVVPRPAGHRSVVGRLDVAGRPAALVVRAGPLERPRAWKGAPKPLRRECGRRECVEAPAARPGRGPEPSTAVPSVAEPPLPRPGAAPVDLGLTSAREREAGWPRRPADAGRSEGCRDSGRDSEADRRTRRTPRGGKVRAALRAGGASGRLCARRAWRRRTDRVGWPRPSRDGWRGRRLTGPSEAPEWRAPAGPVVGGGGWGAEPPRLGYERIGSARRGPGRCRSPLRGSRARHGPVPCLVVRRRPWSGDRAARAAAP